MIDWYKDNNAELRNAFDRGDRKCRLISGDMQKKLAKCCAEEEIDVIMGELRDKKVQLAYRRVLKNKWR
jgi:hypothetical protein